MSHFKPLNAAALFLTTGVLRPGPFWLLLIVTYVISAITALGVTSLTIQGAATTMQNPAAVMDPVSWLTQGLLPLLIQGVAWFVIMLPWVQLMSSGTVRLAIYPFEPAVRSFAAAWAVIWGTYIVLTAMPVMAMGVFGGQQAMAPALAMGVGVILVLAFLALCIAYLWVSLRLTALAPMSFMTEKLAIATVWAGSRGLVWKTFLATLAVMAVGIVLGMLLVVVSIFVPALSVQHHMMNAMVSGEAPGLAQLALPVLAQEVLILPATLMWVGVTVYIAMAIDGWNSDWAREVTQAEERADAA
jgi:hypothetical protein